jgi:hypothetical protein
VIGGSVSLSTEMSSLLKFLQIEGLVILEEERNVFSNNFTYMKESI